MSIQTGAFVNGEWTTRNHDIYAILAGNRAQAEPKQSVAELRVPEYVPELGVLSRTVFRSPLINWILPARIRRTKANDVVFIGEDFVHIKEFREDGHLCHVATKADFKTRIKAARVFGEPRKAEQMRPTDVRPIADHNPSYRYPTRKGEPTEEDNIIPPQVLVLALESQRLMFLYTREDEAGSVHFCECTLAFPPGRSFLEQPGSHLAVDPKSRAIAVAPREGQFIVYSTDSMTQWRENTARYLSNVTPVHEERMFELKSCVILKMEFLSQEASDDNHVILLIVFTSFGQTRISCYDWDAGLGLRSVNIRANAVPLEQEDRQPSLLIPLRRSPDFLLVSRDRFSRYNNVLSGLPSRTSFRFSTDAIPKQSADSRRQPIWTQWERMSRNQTFDKESFYTVREDGVLGYIVVDGNNIPTSTYVGDLTCAVDTAFASLDLEHPDWLLQSPDILIAAGNMCYGESHRIGRWIGGGSRSTTMSPDFIEPIPNWTPISDSMLSKLPNLEVGYKRQRDSLFITSGRAPYGAISELRWGINALIHMAVDLNMTGTTGIWVLIYELAGEANDVSHRIILLLSLPPHSYVYAITQSPSEGWDIDQLPGDSCGAELDQETIAAGPIGRGSSIQITRQEIILLTASSDNEAVLSRIDSRRLSPASSIIAGAVSPYMPYVAIAFRDRSAITLRVTSLLDGSSFGSSIECTLPAEPTCLEIVYVDERPHIVVGTVNSLILMFTYESDRLTAVVEEAVKNTSSGSLPTVCESVVVLSDPIENQFLLACGMRNGDMYCMKILIAPDRSMTVQSRENTSMGQTSARVFKGEAASSAAFVTCGSDLCRIHCEHVKSPAMKIDSVWFTEGTTPGYQQSSISWVAQVPLKGIPNHDLAGTLFVVSGARLLVAQLDHETRTCGDVRATYNQGEELGKAIPRRLETFSTPYKLMYSSRMQMMVTATLEAKPIETSPRRRLQKRTVQSFIDFIKLDDESIESDIKQEEGEGLPGNKLLALRYDLKPYERVYALLDWTYEDSNKKKYGFLVVGTGHPLDNAGYRGRTMFLRTDVDSSGKAFCKIKKEKSFRQPVYSMVLLNERQLAYTTGTELHLDQYVVQDKKWSRLCVQNLPSPGVHVTASMPFVYVSTAQDSVLCYEIRQGDSGLDSDTEMSLILTDGRQRHSTHHLVLNLPSDKITSESRKSVSDNANGGSIALPQTPQPSTLILLSDKSCSLTGLLHPHKRTFKSAAPTVLEASLPRSLTRLRQGNVRPPWRRTTHPPSTFSPSPLSIPGILADDVIGTAVDGSVYAFSILTDHALSLMKLLENLIKVKKSRDPSAKADLHPRPNPNDHSDDAQSPIEWNDVVPVSRQGGTARPKGCHVDGDSLLEYFRDFEKDELSKLVFDRTTEEVHDGFSSYAMLVVIDHRYYDEIFPPGSDPPRIIVPMVEAWLKCVLAPLL